MEFATFWFVFVAVVLTVYALLDAPDLGAGVLWPFAPRTDRRVHVEALRPSWDGNELWLAGGIAALFIAFPPVKSTALAAHGPTLMLLPAALVIRAVAMAVRCRIRNERCRFVCDVGYGLASLCPTLLFGIAIGNVLRGVPFGPAPQFLWQGRFLDLLHPYPLLVGLTSSSLCVLQGALYLRLRAEGGASERLREIALGAFVAFFLLLTTATLATTIVSPNLFAKHRAAPFVALVPLLGISVAITPIATSAGWKRSAFASSAVVMVCLMWLTAYSLYPGLVPSVPTLENSLTVFNSSADRAVLQRMMAVVAITLPIVVGFTSFARGFRRTTPARSSRRGPRAIDSDSSVEIPRWSSPPRD